MLTPHTQTAVAVLNDISCREASSYSCELPDLLVRLESGGLVRLLPGRERGKLLSYELTCPITQITLLAVLEATGEHLDCNCPTCEEFYTRYGYAARKLGVINQLTRSLLSEIILSEL